MKIPSPMSIKYDITNLLGSHCLLLINGLDTEVVVLGVSQSRFFNRESICIDVGIIDSDKQIKVKDISLLTYVLNEDTDRDVEIKKVILKQKMTEFFKEG